MATPQFVPEITAPTQIIEKRGAVAEQIMHKRSKLLHEYRINDRLKPATLLNLIPWSLKVGSALIDYRIPPCPNDKDFAVFIMKTPITYPIFKGAREQHDLSIRQEWDVSIILPVEQLLAFERAYSEDISQDGVAFGGIVVFEGTPDGVLSNSKNLVRTPYYEMQGRDRYLMFRQIEIGEAIETAREMLKRKCLDKLNEAQGYADGNEDQKRNRTPDFNVWADFALKNRWITQLPAWRTQHVVSATELCEKCGERYVSQTGVCKCGFVKEPLKAFKNGEITMDHVRLDVLSPEQWSEVKKIAAARKKNRGASE